MTWPVSKPPRPLLRSPEALCRLECLKTWDGLPVREVLEFYLNTEMFAFHHLCYPMAVWLYIRNSKDVRTH